MTRSSRVAVIAMTLTIALSMIAGPVLIERYNGFRYDRQELENGLSGISAAHPLGTDLLGRDVLARVVYGSRISLLVGLLATAIAVVIGTLYGAVSGFSGPRVDGAMMRLVDVLYSTPTIILVVVLMAFFERGFAILVIALAAVSWLSIARIVRGQVLRLKQEPYVEAARALGASSFTIVTRHIVPNLITPVLTYAVLTVPAVILDESFLSFIGLGVQPPTPSWGVLAAEGAQALSVHPVLTLAPAGAIALTLLCLQWIGAQFLPESERAGLRGRSRVIATANEGA